MIVFKIIYNRHVPANRLHDYIIPTDREYIYIHIYIETEYTYAGIYPITISQQ